MGVGDVSITITSGLQAALDAKVADSQVLTDVPANAVPTDTVINQISQISGLQAALDAKINDSQVLTNVLANATFYYLEV